MHMKYLLVAIKIIESITVKQVKHNRKKKWKKNLLSQREDEQREEMLTQNRIVKIHPNILLIKINGKKTILTNY